jgi:glycosyltransferase involved in cell wall biosynthesis
MNALAPVAADAERRAAFGRSVLGPALALYFWRLTAALDYFEQQRGGRVLFVARGGVRIQRALDVFTTATGLQGPSSAAYLWTSRFMTAKGVWRTSRASGQEVLSTEFKHLPLRELVRAILRSEDPPPDEDALAALEGPSAGLERFLADGSALAERVAAHLERQSSLFERHVAAALRGANAAMLVDTGWRGTIQSLLIDAMPEVDWRGAYLAVFREQARHGHTMMGLMAESGVFQASKPETCIAANRHLFESLFETSGESIENLAEDADGDVYAPQAGANLDPQGDTHSPMFRGVLEHLGSLPAGVTVSTLEREGLNAWRRLARVCLLPRHEDARMLGSVMRSADFGRDVKLPIVMEPTPRHESDSVEARIAEALWPAGQIALEYPPDLSEPMQRRAAGLARSDMRGEAPAVQRFRPKWRADAARVCVVTRTLDRLVFLKRALESVAAQTFDDYVHVVVNDGGDMASVREAVQRADCDRTKIVLVDTRTNRGMEAASNFGVRAVDSEFIAIHDDDDSWSPHFLERTIDFLEGPKGDVYQGVITGSNYVSEVVTPAGIRIESTYPFNDWVHNVNIMEMLNENFFAPIAFVYRRSLFDALGGYDESYPVLGDWDFNVRFLLQADIGVIPERLANYHHRDRGDGAFGNSVIADRDKHVEYTAVVRNRLLRRLQDEGLSGAAALAGLGNHLLDLRRTVRQTQKVIDKVDQAVTARPGADADDAAVRNAKEAQALADTRWIALQHLFRAVAIQDARGLGAAGLTAAGETTEQEPPPRFSPTTTEHLIHLRDGPYRDLEVPPDFDERAYLDANGDVAKAVAQGAFTSGFQHYFYFGMHEKRIRPKRNTTDAAPRL